MDFTDFMNFIFEPLGDYAPVTHSLIIDYKTETGEDCHGEYFPILPPALSSPIPF